MLYDPTGKDKHFLGVMNHIALGVTDIHAAQEQLRKNGAPPPKNPKSAATANGNSISTTPTKLAIEFMEFTPVQKPCLLRIHRPAPQTMITALSRPFRSQTAFPGNANLPIGVFRNPL